MTNEHLQSSSGTQLPLAFGMRLQSAREAQKLDRKDAAAKLRLSEKMIDMIETDTYPPELPITFIRGYIRSYGKLLDVPEHEIKLALEPIKPRPVPENEVPVIKQNTPVTSSHYFMQFFTSIIVLTMVSLVGMWWYTHSSLPSSTNDGKTSNLIPITTLNTAPPKVNDTASYSAEHPTAVPGKTTVNTPAKSPAVSNVVGDEQDEDLYSDNNDNADTQE